MPIFLRNSIVFLLLLFFYATSYTALLNHRATSVLITQQRIATGWTLPPVVLKALAGEFKGLVADLIVLDVGARLGTELVRDPKGGYRTIKKQYDWDAITRSFFTSQALDPSFQQTYMLAEGWLPWKPPGMLTETQELLKTAARNRPWDWQAIHFVGFNTYYFLNKPGEAGKIFLEAAKTPYAPPFLAILGARLAHEGGEVEAAITLMKSMLANKSTGEQGYADMSDRLHALEGVLVLERASKQYEKKFGKKSASLEELTTAGILGVLPKNPYNMPYCIDTSGVIYFDKPNCRSSVTGTGMNGHRSSLR